MPTEFYVDEFKLTVHKDAFLVHVTILRESPSRQDASETLPDWIFNSRLAIWLLDENCPIYDRAKKGDAVKQKLAAAVEVDRRALAAAG